MVIVMNRYQPLLQKLKDRVELSMPVSIREKYYIFV